MKKLAALLLSLIMTVCCVSAAFADTGYLMIQTVLADEEILGEDATVFATEDSTDALLLFVDLDADDPVVMVMGYNSDDTYECTYWAGVEDMAGIAILAYFCQNYTDVAAMTTCSTFAIGYRFDADDDYSFIMSEENAASMYAAIESAFGTDDSEEAN